MPTAELSTPLERLSDACAASLHDLAWLASEVGCQVADLHDDTLSSNPMPLHGLRNVVGRLSGLADLLARYAHGYSDARHTDMYYPGIDDDLREDDWVPARNVS